MTHPTQLQLSMHADGALSSDEASTVTEHVESCVACQAKLTAAQSEARLIASAMQMEAAPDVVVPRFSRPLSLRGFALANLATGLTIWLAQFLWKTLFGELIVNAATRITSLYLPDVYAMFSAATLYLLEEGTAMFDAYLGFVVVCLVTVTVLWLLLIYRRARAATAVCLLMATVSAMVLPSPAVALELLRDEDVITIGESETIDDTLLVAAETVLIEGVVTGDLVAVGRRIDISGTVNGNLLTFAESVTVSGNVGGLALGAASLYDLRGATVADDLWAAGEKVGIDEQAQVGGNATVAAESSSIEGSVGRDLYAFSETVELSGKVGEDLEAFAGRLRLLGDAHIGGNVRFRSAGEDRLHRAETVRVDGDVEFLDMPEELQEGSRYARFEFYLWQIARLIGAFLVGVALLWLVPGFRSISIGAGVEALKSTGLGLVALVSVPIIAVLVAFTIVGLPLTFIAIIAWLLGLYLAKIVVGAIIGRMVLSDSNSLPWTLLAGLAIVIVAVNLPFIGGVISFLLTIFGLGLLVQYVIRTLQAREPVRLTPG